VRTSRSFWVASLAWVAVGVLLGLSVSALFVVTVPVAAVCATLLAPRTGVVAALGLPVGIAAACLAIGIGQWGERTCDTGRSISNDLGTRCVGPSSSAAAPWLIAAAVFVLLAVIGVVAARMLRRGSAQAL
jgi:hypothetical protein